MRLEHQSGALRSCMQLRSGTLSRLVISLKAVCTAYHGVVFRVHKESSTVLRLAGKLPVTNRGARRCSACSMWPCARRRARWRSPTSCWTTATATRRWPTSSSRCVRQSRRSPAVLRVTAEDCETDSCSSQGHRSAWKSKAFFLSCTGAGSQGEAVCGRRRREDQVDPAQVQVPRPGGRTATVPPHAHDVNSTRRARVVLPARMARVPCSCRRCRHWNARWCRAGA